jgi:hypothetical protein
MAGSKKQMVYESDATKLGVDGNGANLATRRKYIVMIDESNGEALGFADYDGQDDGDVEPTPKGLKMRYVIAKFPGDGTVKACQRKLYVGSPENEKFTDGGTIDLLIATSGTTCVSKTFVITSAHGESRSFITNPQNGGTGGSGSDTGLEDGDAS